MGGFDLVSPNRSDDSGESHAGVKLHGLETRCGGGFLSRRREGGDGAGKILVDVAGTTLGLGQKPPARVADTCPAVAAATIDAEEVRGVAVH